MGKRQFDDKILVVIPYLASGAQGRELEYAVAGWRKHFKENFIIVLVGERLPYFRGFDVINVISERVPAIRGQYRQHLDYVRCFREVRKIFPNHKGFIFASDDMYAVRDFNLADVMKLKAHAESFTGDANSGNGWQRDKARTRALLDAEGLPCVNYTTHLPQWYDWMRLSHIHSKYGMDATSYVFEDIYYNLFHKADRHITLENGKDDIRYGVWEKGISIDQIRSNAERVIWITNSIDGWSDNLDKYLSEYYGIQ